MIDLVIIGDLIERKRQAIHAQQSAVEMPADEWDLTISALIGMGRDMSDELAKRSFTWGGIRFDSAGQDEYVRCLVAAGIV